MAQPQPISRRSNVQSHRVPVISFPEPSDVVSPWQFQRNGHLLRPSSYPTSGLASTIRYVLWAIYIYGGISAVVYAVSTFILEPLMIQLTLDRKDFAKYVLDHLVNFNIKLSGAVSTIPEVITWPVKEPASWQQTQIGIEEDKDKSSIDGKHIIRYVNVGTQTRVGKDETIIGSNTEYTDLSNRKASVSFSGTGVQAGGSGLQDDEDLVSHNTTGGRKEDKVESPVALKLEKLNSLLSDLAKADAPANLHNRGLRYSVEELASYADNLQYSNFALKTRTRGGSNNNRLASDIAVGGPARANNASADPANAFRLEIRTIKGALLSARNFPKLSTPIR